MSEKSISKYSFIANDILEKITEKIYVPGIKLPSENQMAKDYSVSVPTVKRALQELVYQKAIYRVKGSGTFVCDIKEQLEENNRRQVNFISNIYFLAFGGYSDSSVMQMIRGAQAYLVERNCNLSILCKQNVHNETDLVEVCYHNHADGIISYVETPEVDHTSLELIKKYQIPTVMIDRGPDAYPHSLVATYNVDGGYQMAKYLLGLGHRKIAFVMERPELPAEDERLKGYKLAIKETGVSLDKELIFKSDDMERLIAYVRTGKCTAIQAVNDKIAAIIIGLLQKDNIVVPRDVSVGGFDDWEEVKYVIPHITTFAQPFEQMGRVAAEKLLRMLEGAEGNSQIYLSGKMMIKDSCCPPMQS